MKVHSDPIGYPKEPHDLNNHCDLPLHIKKFESFYDSELIVNSDANENIEPSLNRQCKVCDKSKC